MIGEFGWAGIGSGGMELVSGSGLAGTSKDGGGVVQRLGGAYAGQ
jgi:hypothetical protein